MHIYLVLMYSLVIANLEGQLGLPNSQRLRRTALAVNMLLPSTLACGC